MYKCMLQVYIWIVSNIASEIGSLLLTIFISHTFWGFLSKSKEIHTALYLNIPRLLGIVGNGNTEITHYLRKTQSISKYFTQ